MDKVLELEKQIQELKKEVEQLKLKRITQDQVIPGTIKNRMMGEPNSYVYSGLAANRPTSGTRLSSTGLGCSIYWAYDTGVLSIWNGSSWLSETLT